MSNAPLAAAVAAVKAELQQADPQRIEAIMRESPSLPATKLAVAATLDDLLAKTAQLYNVDPLPATNPGVKINAGALGVPNRAGALLAPNFHVNIMKGGANNDVVDKLTAVLTNWNTQGFGLTLAQTARLVELSGITALLDDTDKASGTVGAQINDAWRKGDPESHALWRALAKNEEKHNAALKAKEVLDAAVNTHAQEMKDVQARLSQCNVQITENRQKLQETRDKIRARAQEMIQQVQDDMGRRAKADGAHSESAEIEGDLRAIQEIQEAASEALQKAKDKAASTEAEFREFMETLLDAMQKLGEASKMAEVRDAIWRADEYAKTCGACAQETTEIEKRLEQRAQKCQAAMAALAEQHKAAMAECEARADAEKARTAQVDAEKAQVKALAEACAQDNAKLRNELAKSAQSAQSAAQEQKELANNAAACKLQSDRLESDLLDERKRLKEATAELDACRGAQQAAREAAEREAARAEAALTDAKQEIDATKGLSLEARSRLRRLLVWCALRTQACMKGMSAVKEQLRAKTEENGELRAQLAKMQQQVDEETEKARVANEAADKARAENAGLVRQNQSLQQQSTEATTRANRVQQKLEQWRTAAGCRNKSDGGDFHCLDDKATRLLRQLAVARDTPNCAYDTKQQADLCALAADLKCARAFLLPVPPHPPVPPPPPPVPAPQLPVPRLQDELQRGLTHFVGPVAFKNGGWSKVSAQGGEIPLTVWDMLNEANEAAANNHVIAQMLYSVLFGGKPLPAGGVTERAIQDRVGKLFQAVGISGVELQEEEEDEEKNLYQLSVNQKMFGPPVSIYDVVDFAKSKLLKARDARQKAVEAHSAATQAAQQAAMQLAEIRTDKVAAEATLENARAQVALNVQAKTDLEQAKLDATQAAADAEAQLARLAEQREQNDQANTQRAAALDACTQRAAQLVARYVEMAQAAKGEKADEAAAAGHNVDDAAQSAQDDAHKALVKVVQNLFAETHRLKQCCEREQRAQRELGAFRAKGGEYQRVKQEAQMAQRAAETAQLTAKAAKKGAKEAEAAAKEQMAAAKVAAAELRQVTQAAHEAEQHAHAARNDRQRHTSTSRPQHTSDQNDTGANPPSSLRRRTAVRRGFGQKE